MSFRDFMRNLRDKIIGANGQRKLDRVKYSDKMNFVVTGQPTFELIHQDGIVDSWTLHNIVVQQGSVLVQKLLMMQDNTYGITHFALGLGDPEGVIPNNCIPAGPWPCNNPPAAPNNGGRTSAQNKPVLVQELARKKIDTRQYVNEDGSISQVRLDSGEYISIPTHIAVYKALFLEKEGNGPIMEFGLFGGSVNPIEYDYIPSFQTDDNGILLKDGLGAYIPNTGLNRLIDPGDAFTYKTHKLFWKTSQDRLRVSYRIKIELNNAPPEPAAE